LGAFWWLFSEHAENVEMEPAPKRELDSEGPGGSQNHTFSMTFPRFLRGRVSDAPFWYIEAIGLAFEVRMGGRLPPKGLSNSRSIPEAPEYLKKRLGGIC
jgi:hypothetical protein